MFASVCENKKEEAVTNQVMIIFKKNSKDVWKNNNLNNNINGGRAEKVNKKKEKQIKHSCCIDQWRCGESGFLKMCAFHQKDDWIILNIHE